MTKEYLDYNGLAYFWEKVKTYFTGTQTPLMDGTAATGSSTRLAREDHVHPSDTSRAPLASPSFTGSPTAPTPSTSDDSTKLATTAFVHDVIDGLSTGVTGVKGDAESTYRTGNVNLTPANLGIVDFTGATPSEAGAHGLVPAPSAGSRGRFLSSAGVWTNLSLLSGGSSGMRWLSLRYQGEGDQQRTYGEVQIPNATDSLAGFMSKDDKANLDALVALGPEANVQSDWNQTDTDADDYIKNKPTIPTIPNGFANVKVGSTTVAADTTADTLELAAGTGISLTPDATNDKVTINHSNSVTAGTIGSSSSSSGRTISIPYATYDAQGHITAKGTHTHTIGSLQAGDVTSGTFDAARIPNLDASKITSGTIDAARLPSYVDDVIEAYPRSGATELSASWLSTASGGSALTPETGKIYVLMADSTSYAANSTFRWSGTTYVKLADGGVSSITNAEIDTIIAGS